MKLKTLLFLALLAFLFVGCSEEDPEVTADATPTAEVDPLVGSWDTGCTEDGEDSMQQVLTFAADGTGTMDQSRYIGADCATLGMVGTSMLTYKEGNETTTDDDVAVTEIDFTFVAGGGITLKHQDYVDYFNSNGACGDHTDWEIDVEKSSTDIGDCGMVGYTMYTIYKIKADDKLYLGTSKDGTADATNDGSTKALRESMLDSAGMTKL